MKGFEYPLLLHTRKHGPVGYTNYESFRDWLRDEFLFRCVYCLHREQWYNRGATFHIDHFVPVSVNAAGICDYENLVYACATCNEAKKAVLNLADPCQVAFGDCLRIQADGHVLALNAAGEKLKRVLLLDSNSNWTYRARWMKLLSTLAASDPSLYQEFMSYPDDLPDLRLKRITANSRPSGIVSSTFVLREQGRLPLTY